jgi:uncharacterized protein DUF664
VADERAQLLGRLDLQRQLVPWKCEGPGEADGHRPLVPTSLLMTVAGLVSHLRWAEHLWFEETARHVGHLDLIRELLDGRKGYY